MIDEKKLIEELYALADKESKKCNEAVAINLSDIVEKYTHGEYCYYNAVEIIKSQPKIGGWIPCSEQLPELNKDVLICFPDGDIHIASRTHEELSDFIDRECNIFKNVIAWQPLPEGYNKLLDEGKNEQ